MKMKNSTKAGSMTFRTRREKCHVEIYRKHNNRFAFTQDHQKGVDRTNLIPHLIDNLNIVPIQTIREVRPSSRLHGYYVRPTTTRRETSMKTFGGGDFSRDMYRSLREYTMAQQRSNSSFKIRPSSRGRNQPPVVLSEATQILQNEQNLVNQLPFESRGLFARPINSLLSFTNRISSREKTNPFYNIITPTLKVPAPEHKSEKNQEKLSKRVLFEKLKSNNKILLQPAEISPSPLPPSNLLSANNEEIKRNILQQVDDVKRALQNKEQETIFGGRLSRKVHLLIALAKMERLGLIPSDFSKGKVFSRIPYEKPHSKSFLLAVKLGDLSAARRYLRNNKFLVYDFDYVKQTALHWAARKGHQEMIELLFKNGADVDMCDLMNRSPLYFAAKRGFTEIVKMLITYQADPFIVSKNGRTASEITSNEYIRMYIKKSKQVTILLKWICPQKKNDLWNTWIHYIFHDPFSKPSEAFAAMIKHMSAKQKEKRVSKFVK